MNVFISWSGDRARRIGEAVSKFFSIFGDELQPFFSPKIGAGEVWFKELRAALQECSAAIVILTPEHLASNWVWFELGAIQTREGVKTIIPLLFDTDNDSIPDPLRSRQATRISTDHNTAKDGISAVLRALNKARQHPVPMKTVEGAFNDTWHRERDGLMEALTVKVDEESEMATEDPRRVDIAKAYYPEVNHHLWTLINSMEGPAYLCDEDYNIYLANTAAQLMFNLKIPPGRKRPLNELLKACQERTINFEEVEEHLREHFSPTSQLPVYHAEDIFYRHSKYGFVNLRKIGRPYSNNSADKKVWIVVFNIVYIDNSREYYRDLQHRIAPQGNLYEDDDTNEIVVTPK